MASSACRVSRESSACPSVSLTSQLRCCARAQYAQIDKLWFLQNVTCEPRVLGTHHCVVACKLVRRNHAGIDIKKKVQLSGVCCLALLHPLVVVVICALPALETSFYLNADFKHSFLKVFLSCIQFFLNI